MNWSNLCAVEGCYELAKQKGWCGRHYQQLYKKAADYQPRDKFFEGEKRKHPFYALWFERKQGKLLCDEWLDFKKFIEDISPKPEGNYFLLQIDSSKPFGPDNFKWQEHLKKRDDETNKEWWARKWAARQAANPGMERNRMYVRKYGLTNEEYEEKFKKQNGVCFICEQPETAYDGRTGGVRRLAVDHNHTTMKNRDLLCWRCNGTLGRVEESIELLEKMINYIKSHKENK